MRKAAEYERVLHGGTRCHAGPLQVLVARSSIGRPRLGIIVGKRAAPRAVDRNQVRRQIRESFRLRKANLPPMDIVMRLVRLPATRLELRSALSRLWDRV